ncbi:selenocysteine-specific elongation factor-like [Oppia nitens]|uniref:selenocysteine-specific elongation factor-like n=1 Tax=Oppia nitens TaxID=1686743 RepID=UPI0023DA8DB3|nr:selenocysteine-specific elongation factor-like [Oppia nitens]
MPNKVLNVNIGLLGHVDSGKTSLAKALSTTQSTSCYDKSPQSRDRGITIDLGFSSLSIQCPQRLFEDMRRHRQQSAEELGDQNDWSLQLTFVDSPGHSSLIKTIIGGAQIIDIMILVVDICKGVQTQTAECLVIGEITCDKMIVVLNKVDLIPDDNKRNIAIDKMTKRIRKTLEKTRFSSAPIVAVSAHPTDQNDNKTTNNLGTSDVVNSIGIQHLLDTICMEISLPKRSPDGELILSVDHCFQIRGSGTIMTGTIIQGSISVNDNLEIPSVKTIKKVKSMQMFHQKIDRAIQGDRVGVCITQFDPKLLERGVVCSPGFMILVYGMVANVHRIAYFKGKYTTKAKFHITILHETVIAKTTFFKKTIIDDNNTDNCNQNKSDESFDMNCEYSYVDELNDEIQDNQYYVLIEFERPIILNTGALYIASKLDSDINANVCRLAFYGNVLKLFGDKNYVENDLKNLKIFKIKQKDGSVDRITNEYEVIVKNLLKRETNVQNFVGLRVKLSTGDQGIIDGCFGKSGKIKVRLNDTIKDKSLITTTNTSKSKRNTDNENSDTNNSTNQTQIRVLLEFKRYIYDPNKKMIQN